jgi:hypothetical protein
VASHCNRAATLLPEDTNAQPLQGFKRCSNAAALAAPIGHSPMQQLALVYILLSPPRDFARRENLMSKDFCDKGVKSVRL